jgi:hypothetical protein
VRDLREDPAVAGSSSPVIVLFHTAAPDRSTLSLWKPDIASGQDALASERAERRCPLSLMEIEHLIRYAPRAVGLKPSAIQGEARLRGL